jgi:general secretion pathway protein D
MRFRPSIARTSVVNKASVRSFLLWLCVASAAHSGVAVAQDPPAPQAPATPAAPKKKRTPAATPTQTVPAPTAQGAPPVEGPGEGIKQFESGIDYKPTSPNARVTFNLEDADLPELVRLMSQITGRSFILPSKSRSIKATVYAPTKVTAAEAYQAFLSILELNGMAIVPSGRYLKIVESGRVEGRAVPLFAGDEAVPEGDRYVTRIQQVKNISAEDASKLLERFKSGDGGITAYAPTNILVITDTGTNLKRMLRILEQVDIGRTGEQMWVEPIHHANASDLEKRLADIFDVQGGGGGGGAKPAAAKDNKAPAGAKAGGGTVGGGEVRLTKVIADERTNSLVIVATESAYLRVLEVLKHLDVSMEGEGHMHVHHLQHSDAEEVANTLSNLIGKGGGGGGGGGQQKGQGNPSGDSVFEGKVAITAHKASNALVVTSSSHDYAALKSVINLIDTERRQVFIEAVIMEIGVKRSVTTGLGYHGGVPDVPTSDSLAVLGFNSKQTVSGLQGYATQALAGDLLTGLAVGVFGPLLPNATAFGLSIPAFGVALQAFAADGDANVLSTPHLIASDNVEAEIKVGENVPLQTSSPGGGLGALAGLAGGLGGAAGGAAGLAGGLGRGLGGGFGLGAVPRQDVGTTITITPHLNDSGEIRLAISEEISAAGAPDQTGNLGVRSISRTNAKTEVVVRDQQTVVIGGLMRDEISTSRTKIPILGDIPLLGTLFRTDEKKKIKKNLLLFLTPYILRSPADLRAIYERKMRERQEFIDRYFVFSDSEYDVPVDYSRTRGLLGEILGELMLQDNDRKLALEAQKKPEIGHYPSEPIGMGVSRSGDTHGGEIIGPGQPPAEGQPPSPTPQENPQAAPPPDAQSVAPPNAPPPPEAIEQFVPPPVMAPEGDQ